jgi:hypothetical protein
MSPDNNTTDTEPIYTPKDVVNGQLELRDIRHEESNNEKAISDIDAQIAELIDEKERRENLRDDYSVRKSEQLGRIKTARENIRSRSGEVTDSSESLGNKAGNIWRKISGKLTSGMTFVSASLKRAGSWVSAKYNSITKGTRIRTPDTLGMDGSEDDDSTETEDTDDEEEAQPTNREGWFARAKNALSSRIDRVKTSLEERKARKEATNIEKLLNVGANESEPHLDEDDDDEIDNSNETEPTNREGWISRAKKAFRRKFVMSSEEYIQNLEQKEASATGTAKGIFTERLNRARITRENRLDRGGERSAVRGFNKEHPKMFGRALLQLSRPFGSLTDEEKENRRIDKTLALAERKRKKGDKYYDQADALEEQLLDGRNEPLADSQSTPENTADNSETLQDPDTMLSVQEIEDYAKYATIEGRDKIHELETSLKNLQDVAEKDKTSEELAVTKSRIELFSMINKETDLNGLKNFLIRNISALKNNIHTTQDGNEKASIYKDIQRVAVMLRTLQSEFLFIKAEKNNAGVTQEIPFTEEEKKVALAKVKTFISNYSQANTQQQAA